MNEGISITVEHGIVKLLACSGLRVTDFKVVLANPRFFREGLVNNTAKIASIIESTLAEMKIQENKGKREVICAVPGFQNILRYMTLPKAAGMDPKIVIPREARKSMGVSPETSQLIWHRLPDRLDLSRWIVLSATRRSTLAIVETVEKAGLKVKAVDMRGFALARAVDQPEAVVAWVAQEGCEVVIIKDWVPLAQQSLFWGAEPVEGSILVQRLSEMIERSILSYNRNSSEDTISDDVPLYVSGSPITREPDVPSQVADNLGRTLGQLTLRLETPDEFPVHDMIINVGLNLRDI